MKKYEIPSASKLKEAFVLMKEPARATKVLNMSIVWNTEERKGSGKRFDVYIELGRNARMVQRTNGKLIDLGDMHLTRTREFAKGLSEIEDS